MFTGIIEELGVVKNISRRAGATLFAIAAKEVPLEAKVGDSIAINGVCLTVVKKERAELSFEAIPLTLQLTNLGLLKVGDKINLEPSLKAGDRISGHFVSGHIDCLGVIRKKNNLHGNLCFEIAAPVQFRKFILPKGSVAVDGISLTIAVSKANLFSVNIIPHTLKNTTLCSKGPSDRVNLEFDLLAKRAAFPSP